MSLKSEIKSFRKEQKLVVTRLVAMDKALSKLERDIKRYITKAWKSFFGQKTELYITFYQSGSHTTRFNPYVLVHISCFEIVRGKLERNLYWKDSKTLPEPPSLGSLLDFTKLMTKELGIKVGSNQPKQPTLEERKKEIEKRGVQGFDDAFTLSGGGLELLFSGQVCHDDEDDVNTYYISKKKSNGDLVLVYSTNGGYTYKVIDKPSKEEIKTFVDYVEEERYHEDVRKYFEH
jgi:hypothetical protein